jgi:hypothetical protein
MGVLNEKRCKKQLINTIKRNYNYITFDNLHEGYKNIKNFFVCLSSEYECEDVVIKPVTNYALKYTNFHPEKHINNQIIDNLYAICRAPQKPGICSKFSSIVKRPPELYLRDKYPGTYLCHSFLQRQNNYTAMYLLYNFINSKRDDNFFRTPHDKGSLKKQIEQEQILHIFYVLICNQSSISDASNIILEMNDFEYIDKLEELYNVSTQIHAQITTY